MEAEDDCHEKEIAYDEELRRMSCNAQKHPVHLLNKETHAQEDGKSLEDGWFERARAAKFSSTEDAARACKVSTKLMWHLECGSVTAPELAWRIGRVLGLTRTQTDAITCYKSLERRILEARALREGE